METAAIAAKFIYDDGAPYAGATITFTPVAGQRVESLVEYPNTPVVMTSDEDGRINGELPKPRSAAYGAADWLWDVAVVPAQGSIAQRKLVFGQQKGIDFGLQVVFRSTLVVTSADLAALAATKATVRRPEEFGAVGDGEADDTEALEALLDALEVGDTLWLAPSKVYTHSVSLTVTTDGVAIRGGGEVQATDEEDSAFSVTSDYVTIDGPLFSCPETSQRWDTLTHQKLQLRNNVGCVVRNVRVDGSAAAGIFTYGAAHALIEKCFVENTRADAFHNVKGSHHIDVNFCEALNVGDDGFAAVSYASGVDAGKTHDIHFFGCRIENTTHGRLFAVAGADNVTFDSCVGKGSHAAGIIVVSEQSYDSYGCDNILFRNIEIEDANSVGEGKPDHGAIIVSCEDEGKVISNVRIRGVRVRNTSLDASRNLSIIEGDGEVENIIFEDVKVSGGPGQLYYTNVDESKYQMIDVKGDGSWGWELLAAKRMLATDDTSGVIEFTPRRQLMIVVRVNGTNAPDIPALKFNGSADNYWTRYLTVPAGSATLTNVETDDGTMMRLSGIASQGLRQSTVMIANHPGWPKVATISTVVESGGADAGAIELPGSGAWHDTDEQITSVELIQASGATMNDNTEILVFGQEVF